MGRPEGLHQPPVVLRLQRCIHFIGSKCEQKVYIFSGSSLNDSTDPPFPCGHTNLRPLTLGKKHTCLDNCRCSFLERMGIPRILGVLRRRAAME